VRGTRRRGRAKGRRSGVEERSGRVSLLGQDGMW